ncbi:MAG: class I SAM-dependent methyltransferase [bacterium]|nr:class I SAM-dependent methyltransferase [bacterium]
MKTKSINSYDDATRVKKYDADMEIMHPNRSKMIDIALEVLPFERESSFTALELGTGTGYFTGKFIKKFPEADIISIDGAESMIDLAKSRLGDLADKIDFRTGDFRNLNTLISPDERGNIVFSSYSLHHLDYDEKLETLKKIREFLLPGGWLINADLIVAETPEIEERIQQIRIDGIVKRAGGKDKRFIDQKSARKFIKDLEAEEEDKPLPITEDIILLEKSGFSNTSVFWLEYRETVYGGINN